MSMGGAMSPRRFPFTADWPSAAEPQPKNLGIGELTTKGAKNAKEKSDYLPQRDAKAQRLGITGEIHS